MDLFYSISGRAGERFSIRVERKNHESRSRFAFSRGSQKVEGEGRKRSHPTFIHFQGKVSRIPKSQIVTNSQIHTVSSQDFCSFCFLSFSLSKIMQIIFFS